MTSQMTETTHKRLEQLLADPEIHDALNQAFIFQQTMPDLLLAIVSGMIDPLQLAREQLADRGLDQNGVWCGFDRAAEIWGVQR